MALYDWDSAWATTSINGNITNTSTSTTAAISNDLKAATEVSVEIAYGVTASQGVKVQILRDVDGSNYEASADAPFEFEMPKTVSTTHRRTFTVPGSVSNFKVSLSNNSGATVTAVVRTRQAIV